MKHSMRTSLLYSVWFESTCQAKSACLAEVLGWRLDSSGRHWVDEQGRLVHPAGTASGAWNPVENFDHAWEVLEWLEKGLVLTWEEFRNKIISMLHNRLERMEYWTDPKQLKNLVEPEDICIAALWALEHEEYQSKLQSQTLQSSSTPEKKPKKAG